MGASDDQRTPKPAWRAWLSGHALGAALGRFARFAAALQLGFAVALLAIAWQFGPAPAFDAAHYRAYTARTEGTIAESWVALEFDPDGDAYWMLRARATPCMVVNVVGDWGAPLQRAFCGARYAYDTDFTLQNLHELSPGVAFAWRRDARGFALPEIRMTREARAWLTSHAPPEPSSSSNASHNAYDAWRLLIDRPVEQAIAGWVAPAPTIALAFDPRQPGEAVPRGFIDAKTHANAQPAVAIAAALFGLLLWFQGMSLLMAGLPRKAMLFAAILPLLALPWWGEHVPRAIARLDARVAEGMSALFDGVSDRNGLHASAPQDALLAGGERVLVTRDQSVYAETLGRVPFAAPLHELATADAALAALVDVATRWTRGLDGEARRALFAHLTEDKRADRRGAGLLFLAAARAQLLDPAADPASADAAQEFLRAWTTPPFDLPQPTDAAYAERVRLYRALADIADPDIADGARAILALAQPGTH